MMNIKFDEKYPYKYSLMRDTILPRLLEVIINVDKIYRGSILSVCLLKNVATGAFINPLHGNCRGQSVIELGIVFSHQKRLNVNNIVDIIYERIENSHQPCQIVYHFNLPLEGYDAINASLSKRMRKCFYIHRNNKVSSVIQMKDVAESNNSDMWNQLIYSFAHYTWQQKRFCLEIEPYIKNDVKRSEYQKCAAVAHLWAKQNYLEIPPWVYKPFYIEETFSNSSGYGSYPVEFTFHGLERYEQEFINV